MSTRRVTEQLINRILALKPADVSDAAWLAKELGRIDAIEERIIVFCRRETAAEETRRSTLGKIASERRAVQETCPHYDTTYHPDAAGGNDSFTRCNICQKDLG